MQILLRANVCRSKTRRPGWINEEKYVDFRALASWSGKEVRIYSRNLKYKTADLPGLVQAFTGLRGENFVRDREIVSS